MNVMQGIKRPAVNGDLDLGLALWSCLFCTPAYKFSGLNKT